MIDSDDQSSTCENHCFVASIRCRSDRAASSPAHTPDWSWWCRPSWSFCKETTKNRLVGVSRSAKGVGFQVGGPILTWETAAETNSIQALTVSTSNTTQTCSSWTDPIWPFPISGCPPAPHPRNLCRGCNRADRTIRNRRARGCLRRSSGGGRTGAAPLRRRDDPASPPAAPPPAVWRVRKRPRCSRPPLMPDSTPAPNLNRESDVLEVGRVGKRKQRKNWFCRCWRKS